MRAEGLGDIRDTPGQQGQLDTRVGICSRRMLAAYVFNVGKLGSNAVSRTLSGKQRRLCNCDCDREIPLQLLNCRGYGSLDLCRVQGSGSAGALFHPMHCRTKAILGGNG